MVNDSVGYVVGDVLLCEFVLLMFSMFCFGDFLVCLGGDEFGLLLLDCNSDSVCFIVMWFINVVNEYYFMWEGCLYWIGVSVGIIMINEYNC